MKPDSKHIKSFIHSAINQRQKLLAIRGSRRNTAQAAKYIDFLRTHLNAHHYTSEQLARFFCRHYDKIVYLLPPTQLPKAEQLKDEIINPKLF